MKHSVFEDTATNKAQTTTTTTSIPDINITQHSSPRTEYGWACPRCGRINAPWKSQCECSGGYWYPTWYSWDYKEPWWKHVTCDSDTFKVHPETTTWKAPSSMCGSDSTRQDPNSTIYTTAHSPVVGGSDYWDNTSQTWSNMPNVSNSSTSVDSPWNQYYTLTSDKINDLQNQINNLKETK